MNSLASPLYSFEDSPVGPEERTLDPNESPTVLRVPRDHICRVVGDAKQPRSAKSDEFILVHCSQRLVDQCWPRERAKRADTAIHCIGVLGAIVPRLVVGSRDQSPHLAVES
jgi:hypothetical protein